MEGGCCEMLAAKVDAKVDCLSICVGVHAQQDEQCCQHLGCGLLRRCTPEGNNADCVCVCVCAPTVLCRGVWAVYLLDCGCAQCICKLSGFEVQSWLGPTQVQTIKTAVESAQMLLRIDDIVSGISKKQQEVSTRASFNLSLPLSSSVHNGQHKSQLQSFPCNYGLPISLMTAQCRCRQQINKAPCLLLHSRKEPSK
eukprot:733013-Pelagomonas_calceolata.AAC.3